MAFSLQPFAASADTSALQLEPHAAADTSLLLDSHGVLITNALDYDTTGKQTLNTYGISYGTTTAVRSARASMNVTSSDNTPHGFKLTTSTALALSSFSQTFSQESCAKTVFPTLIHEERYVPNITPGIRTCCQQLQHLSSFDGYYHIRSSYHLQQQSQRLHRLLQQHLQVLTTTTRATPLPTARRWLTRLPTTRTRTMAMLLLHTARRRLARPTAHRGTMGGQSNRHRRTDPEPNRPMPTTGQIGSASYRPPTPTYAGARERPRPDTHHERPAIRRRYQCKWHLV